MSPLRRLELTLVALCGAAAWFRPVDAGLAAIALVAALELMRLMS
jgi:hypothetical protein